MDTGIIKMITMVRAEILSNRLLGILALLLFVPLTAYAGFQWTPPGDQPANAGEHALSPMPVTPVEKTKAPVPVIRSESVDEQINYEDITGFGNDIPLGLATRQIVPDDFSFSFDTDIDPGLRVSWQGGKAWNAVLEETLEPHDLKADIRNNKVRITKTEHYQQADMHARPYQKAEIRERPGPVDQQNRQKTRSAHAVPFESAEKHHGHRASTEPVALMPQSEDTGPVSASGKSMKHINAGKPVPLIKDRDGNVRAWRSAPASPPVRTEQNASPVNTGNYDIGFWKAARGTNLKDVLTSWARQAGTEIYWDSSYDYKLPQSIKMHGTFADAVQAVLQSYQNLGSRPVGKLYPNRPNGPAVLVIRNVPS